METNISFWVVDRKENGDATRLANIALKWDCYQEADYMPYVNVDGSDKWPSPNSRWNLEHYYSSSDLSYEKAFDQVLHWIQLPLTLDNPFESSVASFLVSATFFADMTRQGYVERLDEIFGSEPVSGWLGGADEGRTWKGYFVGRYERYYTHG